MRIAAALAAALLLASCYEPGGQCTADTDCLADQVCGAGGLCVTGTRPPPGAPPSAAADSFDFTGSGPFDVPKGNGVLKNDVDPEGARLEALLVADATYGQVWLAPDGAFTYAPLARFNGTDTFTYRATNGTLASGDATVTIRVAGPPLSAVDAYAFTGRGPFSVAAAGVLANDADQNGAALTVKLPLVSNAASGTVVMQANGAFTYTPANPSFSGTDRFTYQATNGTVVSDPTIVTITVTGPPVAAADAYAVAAPGPLVVLAADGVLKNDADPRSLALTAVLDTDPTNGTLALAADGSFQYAPGAGFTGTDAFTYHASNGTLSSDPATVTITVSP